LRDNYFLPVSLFSSL